MYWFSVIVLLALSGICVYQIYKLIIDIKHRKDIKKDKQNSKNDSAGGELKK